MPCCVPLCPSNALKVSSFRVPKNETLKLEWERVLGVSFKPNSKVCRRHFREEDVIDTWESGQGFSKYTIDLKRPSLQKGAVPIRSASSISKIRVSEDSKSCNHIDTVSKKGISSNSKSSKVLKISTDHCYLDDDNKSGNDTTNKIRNANVSGEIASPLNDINPSKRIKKWH
uniref:THAP-type domain-containing protein n=1 Tax=Schizaphis graminum TaxID=13262 RepID=A0A2S2PH77_SCHGA